MGFDKATKESAGFPSFKFYTICFGDQLSSLDDLQIKKYLRNSFKVFSNQSEPYVASPYTHKSMHVVSLPAVSQSLLSRPLANKQGLYKKVHNSAFVMNHS